MTRETPSADARVRGQRRSHDRSLVAVMEKDARGVKSLARPVVDRDHPKRRAAGKRADYRG